MTSQGLRNLQRVAHIDALPCERERASAAADQCRDWCLVPRGSAVCLRGQLRRIRQRLLKEISDELHGYGLAIEANREKLPWNARTATPVSPLRFLATCTSASPRRVL